jgi:hypothetical protein
MSHVASATIESSPKAIIEKLRNSQEFSPGFLRHPGQPAFPRHRLSITILLFPVTCHRLPITILLFPVTCHRLPVTFVFFAFEAIRKVC